MLAVANWDCRGQLPNGGKGGLASRVLHRGDKAEGVRASRVVLRHHPAAGVENPLGPVQAIRLCLAASCAARLCHTAIDAVLSIIIC